ncbi:MAG: hypothetical protein SNJ57_11690, partial [Cyanobacteriota bacterium]
CFVGVNGGAAVPRHDSRKKSNGFGGVTTFGCATTYGCSGAVASALQYALSAWAWTGRSPPSPSRPLS